MYLRNASASELFYPWSRSEHCFTVCVEHLLAAQIAGVADTLSALIGAHPFEQEVFRFYTIFQAVLHLLISLLIHCLFIIYLLIYSTIYFVILLKPYYFVSAKVEEGGDAEHVRRNRFPFFMCNFQHEFSTY